MGRSKRGKKSKRPDSDVEDAIGDEGPDPESDDFFHDDVDKFNLNRDKLLLDVEGDDSEDEDSIEEEEIMGLDLPESDDDDDHDDEEENDEDDDSEEETKLPSNKSWGKKKASFYSADATEQDIGSDEEAWEMEKEEEIEAMALQQRMAAGLDEEDFDTTNYQIPQEDDTEDRSLEDEEIDKTVVMDLTKLSKEQKLEILFRDSPELFELLDQFKVKLQQLVSQISPLMQLSKLGKVSAEGSKYIELKYKLYLNYCINIAFYLLLKSKQTPVKDHPVIARIVQYRNLIKELEPIDKNLESNINFLLDNKDMILQQSESTFETITTSRNTAKAENSKEKNKAKKSKAKLSDLLNDSDEDETEERNVQPPPKKSKNSASSNNIDSENPLDYYEKVRLEKEKAKEIKDLAARLMYEPHLELEDLDVNEEGKRAITYQISKNKGLTAKKKKEDRNPRVKHRKKYSKAIVKRKSQVRPVVNETTRYDGEKSGIRAFLTRSIKIK